MIPANTPMNVQLAGKTGDPVGKMFAKSQLPLVLDIDIFGKMVLFFKIIFDRLPDQGIFMVLLFQYIVDILCPEPVEVIFTDTPFRRP